MKHIPPWAMSWPGDQLSGIGRNGKFIQNTKCYENLFDDAFHHFPNFKKDDDTIRINYGAIASGNNV